MSKPLNGCSGASRYQRKLLLAIAGLNLGCGILVHGASLVWDANGSAAGIGGTGNWDNSNPLWITAGTTYTAWVSGSTAVFNATAGTVTTAAAITAGGLTFNAPYTLAGSSVLTLNGSTPTINTNGVNVTDSLAAGRLALSSTGNVIYKTGAGILTLINDQSGSLPNGTTWNISGGTLNASTGLYNSGIALSDGKELGPSTGSILTLNGGTLSFTASGGAGFYTARALNVTAAGGAVSDGGFAPGEAVSGGGTISPAVSIAAGNGLNLVANDILEFDNNGGAPGVISGAGGVNIYGAGIAEILSTANTYSGGTNITAGSTLLIGGTGSLGTGNLTVAGTLNLNNITYPTKALTSNGGTFQFNLSSGGTTNKLTATSAVMSGTTQVVLGINLGTVVQPGSTYTLATSTGGGLTGSVTASFALVGSENLTVPVNAVMETIGGVPSRLVAMATANGSSITMTTAVTVPAHTISIMPLGSSITEGISAQNPYDGGGYRSQLYQNLVNDGRFNPLFVGSATTTGSNNPTGNDLMTTVGQTHHEGHSGYTTNQTLANIDGNDNSGGNDGGYWLAPGNGVNPDFITLNIGGNDFVANPNDTAAITRLDQILTEIYALRPNATIVVSNIMYRGDGSPAGVASVGATGTTGFENLYNPLIPNLVYQHVLAGQHVSFIDMNTAVTPNNSLALIGPDFIHPTQAGYDLMANLWYASITTGQAFYTGNAGTAWNANGSGGATSWAMDFKRTTDSGVSPSSGTDVYFNGIGGTTTLGADTAVRSVNFASNVSGGAAPAVTIAGPNVLTIGSGGITVQANSGTNTISAPVVLGGNQNWSNVSTTPFTVSGSISGSSALATGGTGVIILSGNNNYSGATTITSGTLTAGSSNALGTGNVTLANVATLALGLDSSNNATVLGNPVIISLSATLLLAPTANYSSGGVGPITLAADAAAVVSIGANASAGVTHGVLVTPSLTLANPASGTLDLGKNDLDLTSQTLASASALVASASKNNWTGAGITSSSARTDASHLTALGVIANTIDGTTPLYGNGGTLARAFDGIQPAAGDVLVKYSWYGDANLDGIVDGSDYSRIDAAFGTSATGWFNGDFNYDSVVNGSDYTLIDNAFNNQSVAMQAAVASQVANASLPEPTAALFSFPLFAMLGARRIPKSV